MSSHDDDDDVVNWTVQVALLHCSGSRLLVARDDEVNCSRSTACSSCECVFGREDAPVRVRGICEC